MFEIKVNGKVIKLLQPITDIKSVVIQHMQGIPIPVARHQTKAIAEWLYNLTQAPGASIEYNGVILPQESINKPKHMK